MKYLLPFFLVLCSCGWFNPDKGFPDKDPVPPPPQDVVSEEDPERVVYIPYEVDVEHGYTSEESCKVEEHLEVIGPYKAETKIVNFVYGTIDFDQSIPVTRDEVRESDYIHAKQVDLYITAGEDFDFFSWVKIYLGDHLVAWGGPQRS
ncbi:hypothetical protein GWN63_03860, partial [Candidatus Bathyarchaeota archaeon]|nr:hypothetical protein [Candidatus Bathyarchaeota archaeon]NIR16246.1 hypothetical protein [Desulfobacterales bacterium]NIU81365.1 hypothetical protein [Candidatus Bathyarchaeota archaeon]NIV67951.1 hypothetical protein [Candidatus Bathyarchaeota archaeon]NIW34507.1 hypothetical protein [Candidatus Bathyarchaeota archaeon]